MADEEPWNPVDKKGKKKKAEPDPPSDWNHEDYYNAAAKDIRKKKLQRGGEMLYGGVGNLADSVAPKYGFGANSHDNTRESINQMERQNILPSGSLRNYSQTEKLHKAFFRGWKVEFQKDEEQFGKSANAAVDLMKELEKLKLKKK